MNKLWGGTRVGVVGVSCYSPKDDLADFRPNWLPITFIGKGNPEILWHDAWTIP